jgi:hypothetical protein
MKGDSIVRSGHATRGGSTLIKTLNSRQQATRKWVVVLCFVLGLALVSGLIGSLTHQTKASGTADSTAFSYFPAD